MPRSTRSRSRISIRRSRSRSPSPVTPRGHAARGEHSERGVDREGADVGRPWHVHRRGRGGRRGADELHVQRDVLAGDERQQHLGLGWPGVNACALRRWRQLRRRRESLKNAMPFASAKDPRVPTTGSPLPKPERLRTFDGITPLVSSAHLAQPRAIRFRSRTASMRV